MSLWTVDLRLNAAIDEEDWACFQSKLGPNASSPILGYEVLAARTVQLRRLQAPSEDEAGQIALSVIASAAVTCKFVLAPTVIRVIPSA